MKYCEEYAALLDLFVDGELPAEELNRVGDHLAECPGCRAYVDDALAIRAAFPDVEDTAVPEGFARGVMKRVRAAKRRPLRRWMGTAAALAACCALVILIRTGPAGGDRAAAPAGDAGGTAVTYGSGGSAAEDAPEAAPEMGIAPRMAPESEEAPAEKSSRMAETGGQEEFALAAAPRAVMEAAMNDESGLEEAALRLTWEEAGDLLDGFSVVWENAVEWRYELNKEEFRALLEALGRLEELPEGAEGPFLVVVSGPEE